MSCPIFLVYRPTGNPTTNPTLNPTVEPSQIPTTSIPTAFPTAQPTVIAAVPSTISPTTATTASAVCEWMYVVLTNFEEITASALSASTALQDVMVNITHEAIAQSVSGYTNRDSFSVDFQNASDGLSITFGLCASTEQTLNTVQLVMENHEEDINDAMKAGLTEEFGSDSDFLTVTVSLTEFRVTFKGCHDPLLG